MNWKKCKNFFTGESDSDHCDDADVVEAEVVDPDDDADDESRLRRKYSEAQLQERVEMVKYVMAASPSTDEEIRAKVVEFRDIRSAKIVKVYIWGDGDGEFATDKDLATMAAEKGYKVSPGLAREDARGNRVLMSKSEVREYLKKHPRLKKV